MRKPTSRLGLLGAFVAFILFASASAFAQEVKLYLKDGSYQVIKSYKVEGDRVLYYSLERSQWEEIPKSLVDFDATRKAQQQETVSREKSFEAAKELEKQHFETASGSSVPAGFQVAPGVPLPPTEGVYAYDGLRVITLIQSEGQIVTDRERQVLKMALPGPLLKSRALLELPGPKAAVRIAMPQPVFYIQADDGWGAKAELIPVKSAKDSRVVEKVQSGLGVGPSGEQRNALPLQRTEVAHGVLRLQPARPLAPGEYAIGELIDGKLNLDVWDFGIDRPSKETTAEAGQSAPVMSEQRPGAPPPASPTSVILHPGAQQGSTPPLPNPGPPSPPDAPNPPN